MRLPECLYALVRVRERNPPDCRATARLSPTMPTPVASVPSTDEARSAAAVAAGCDAGGRGTAGEKGDTTTSSTGDAAGSAPPGGPADLATEAKVATAEPEAEAETTVNAVAEAAKDATVEPAVTADAAKEAAVAPAAAEASKVAAAEPAAALETAKEAAVAPEAVATKAAENKTQNMATRRIKKELDEWVADPPPGCSATPDPDNSFLWQASIMGPEGSAYEGERFDLQVKFPEEYPFKPPGVRFQTRINHCNVTSNGGISMDTLVDQWTPVLTIAKVMLLIVSLLKNPKPVEPAVNGGYEVVDAAGNITTIDGGGRAARAARASLRAAKGNDIEICEDANCDCVPRARTSRTRNTRRGASRSDRTRLRMVKLLEDPEIQDALKNPRIKSAWDEVTASGSFDAAAGFKFFEDPDQGPFIRKCMAKM